MVRIDMENGHSAKRQKTGVESQWTHRTTNHNNSIAMNGVVLPAIGNYSAGNVGSPGQPLYQQNSRTASSPRPYPDMGSGYHEQQLPKYPHPAQDSRPFPNSAHPFNDPNNMKREMENQEQQYRGKSHLPSPRPVENGQYPQRSPPSHFPPPFEQANGNVPGPPPYPARAAAMPPNITTNGRYDQRGSYAPSPEAPASADGLYPPHPFGGAPPPNNAGKKKAQRASQACDSCRSLKAKCDESKPCQSCKDKEIPCTYRQPEPKAQDKIQTDMLNKLSTLVSSFEKIDQVLHAVQSMGKEVGQLNARMTSLENMSRDAPFSPNSTNLYFKAEKMEEAANAYKDVQPEPTMMSVVRRQDKMDLDSEDATAWQEAPSDEETDPPLNPSKPKFGIQHTTGAVELLNWPGVSDLVSDEVKNSRVNKGKGAKTDRYLWKAEKRRGEMRPHGYGEGHEPKAPRDHDGYGSDGHTWSDSPHYFSEGPFGLCAGKPYYILPDVTKGTGKVEETYGGLFRDGTLDFSRSTVKRLIDSYLTKMNDLHPILSKKEVDRLVRNFLREVHQTSDAEPIREKTPIARTFVVTPAKRARDRITPDRVEHAEPASSPEVCRQLPQRSPSNAVVLLMLAIGKVCEAKAKVPEISWGGDDLSSAELRRIKGSTSPDHSSPSSPVSAVEHLSPRASLQHNILPASLVVSEDEQRNISGKPRPVKNKEVIHGAAYFATATDLIGNEVSGSTIQHIQANILASLYYGQLVRPVQSYGYLHIASRAIQDEIRLKSSLMPANLPKTASGEPGSFCQPQDNPLVFAYWTCLQLECDIVAELACVHSGILGYEELMPYPNTKWSVANEGMSQKVSWSYDAQLWLRKHLNDIHAHYTPPDTNTSSLFDPKHRKKGERFSSIEAVELGRVNQFGYNKELDFTVWPLLTWNFDDKEPDLATDILNARTRAKFYGARVITYRPFVKAILKYSRDQQRARTGENPPVEDVDTKSSLPGVDFSANFTPRKWHGDRDAPLEMQVKYSYSDAHWDYFGRGIRALINSTTAFHGMTGSRLIVTNIFGTVHAQWGNVLVLLACYYDEQIRTYLFEYIDEEKFKKLVRRTFEFLKEVAPSTSGLQSDIKILRAAILRSQIFSPDDFEFNTPPATGGGETVPTPDWATAPITTVSFATNMPHDTEMR